MTATPTDYAPNPAFIERAADLAERLMRRAEELETGRERRARKKFGALMDSPSGTTFTTNLLDRALRPKNPKRVAELVSDALNEPIGFLRLDERFLLRAFSKLWPISPKLAVGMFMRRLRAEAHKFVISAEDKPLQRYLTKRERDDVFVNLNLVGEAVLGADEAETRLRRYETALKDARIQAIAVKLSTVCTNVRPLAYDAVVETVADSLRRLYRAAGPKLVTLDMEEYHDLEPTLDVYLRVLMEDEFLGRRHGVALQAYLPDSFAALGRITETGSKRVGMGGAPLRVRIVKGANLAMERFESSLHDWKQAPYPGKQLVDSNMKRMVECALSKENATGLHTGIGSHNVFDIAFAITYARDQRTIDSLTIEMLQGMAEPLRRAVAEIVPTQLVYAPATTDAEFVAAVAYLIRRLDENSSKENFLRHALTMNVGDPEWTEQRRRYVEACAHVDEVTTEPMRNQNRNDPQAPTNPEPFHNCADTDFVKRVNRDWARSHITDTTLDPEPELADDYTVDAAVARAKSDPSGWSSRTLKKRKQILFRAADILEERRGELLGVMSKATYKTAAEADPEISEAIDFVRYYGQSLDEIDADDRVTHTPRGVVAVLAPWNFPIAIPLGGVSAALIGGNRVILKPSPFSILVALAGARALWDAGVPRETLQVVHCDVEPSAHLAAHTDVDGLVFTGSTATATAIMKGRPELHFLAETGGKNATMVMATADRDQAIRNILKSAFGHSGQKCSATSLVIAEAEVYDDPDFRRRLVDAATTLRVGPSTTLGVDITRCVTPPNAALAQTLDGLPAGEEWALAPRIEDGVLTPGVIWNVQPGSFTHMNEMFGPVLAVMRADDFDHGIALVNQTGYGLTSGIESLRYVEWARWLDEIEAGNLYINRSTTGAVVQRQPFGGWRKSGYGPGAKAGGPNYVAQLVNLKPIDPKSALEADYDGQFANTTHDPQDVLGQANIFRYRPAPGVVIRVDDGDDPNAFESRKRAARAAGCDFTVSSHEKESNTDLAKRLGEVRRVVRCGPGTNPELLAAAAENWIWIDTTAITGTSRDMLPFLLEQSLSVDYHRYGWIPPGAEKRQWLQPPN